MIDISITLTNEKLIVTTTRYRVVINNENPLFVSISETIKSIADLLVSIGFKVRE